MQAEAGQSLDVIIRRKDLEREANGGLFLWGVGNAPSRFTHIFARMRRPISAIFSVMKSKPKRIDAEAEDLVLWRAYFDSAGKPRPLPPASIVTSRAGTSAGRKRAHYALMCQSNVPLQINRGGARFDPLAFRNVGEQGGPVGSSQVTALLRQVAMQRENASYEVNMTADLVEGYWVRLCDPVLIGPAEKADLDNLSSCSVVDWAQLAARLRDRPALDSPDGLLV
ncbi:MAG: hypothetical protein KJZ64_13465 [Sphingomonadaceae bacterium]|nr:hypothetical protein [Sphingomonadaceae bacterium]